MCTLSFFAALFTIAKMWKQPSVIPWITGQRSGLCTGWGESRFTVVRMESNTAINE